ncbi:MFS general substrate transporter [Fomitiporia mediterranea MF3/22]|uniref:MFS general substrate transporter n=1 Tax=Fomitiporia mediterranea (strain MF3/22) TaxID=694068 RepID=UPI0004408EF4|nr:MFS general substrate transporter [Fomitiporia mediterranea MF3/22]EJD00756.1 MFS general substrate transporter [Fomitiporia mediterranea MF3/22]
MSSRIAPKVLSVPRLTTLASSIVVALSSGTNYVYSAYAPQLGTQLRISHTKLNIIGLAGNIGVYSTGPFWGRIVDRRGPRILLASAFALLLVGYSGIRYFYNNPDHAGANADAERISHFAFAVMTLCSFFTGAGGNGGFTSAVNASAKSFPDEMRASATGLVISGFGLSAFFFSALARILYPDDTSSFLLVLALGTSCPMILGFFFVRPIPLPSDSDDSPDPTPTPAPGRLSITEVPHDGFAQSVGVDSVFAGDALVYEHHDDSQTTLLATHRHAHHHQHRSNQDDEYAHQNLGSPAPRRHSVEFAVSSPPSGQRHRSMSAVSHKSRNRVIEVLQEVHGKGLLLSGDFWLLFCIMSLLAGTGLMYINNVGSISQALFAQGDPDFDPVESAKWQSTQVSIISLANFIGRILSGVGADLVKNGLGAPRTYCICVVAMLFVISQVIATHVENVRSLWQASALLGIAYGGMFGLFPTIVIEWFGLTHFSENWGFVSLSPLVGGNLFSLAFGRNLDAHNPPTEPGDSSPSTFAARAGLPAGEQCFAGRDCYVASLYLTITACTVATGLSFYAAWKDRRRMTVKPADYEEILWEDDEEEV